MCAIAQSLIEPQCCRASPGCGSIEFGGVKGSLLAACARRLETGGSRRRQGAAVPIGTKKMVGLPGSGMTASGLNNTLHVK